MTENLIALTTPDGHVLVEVDDLETGGYEPISLGGDVVVRAQQTLDQAMETIHDLATSVANAMTRVPSRPSSTEVSFSLKFGASAGVIVAKGSAAANVQVKLTWTDPTVES